MVSDFASSITTAMRKSRCQRPLITSGKTDEPSGKLFDIFERGCAFGLCRLAHLEARDELTEILIASLRSAQQQQPRRLGGMLVWQPGWRCEHISKRAHCNLGANMRSHATSDTCCVKACCTVKPIAIG